MPLDLGHVTPKLSQLGRQLTKRQLGNKLNSSFHFITACHVNYYYYYYYYCYYYYTTTTTTTTVNSALFKPGDIAGSVVDVNPSDIRPARARL